MNGNGNPVKMKHDTHFPAPVDLQVFLKQEKSFGADAARRPRQPGPWGLSNAGVANDGVHAPHHRGAVEWSSQVSTLHTNTKQPPF